MFDTLRIHNWRQFESVEVKFHPRLTVLTGANGAGKTTLLHLLNRHWGWNLQFVSVPRLDGRSVSRYRSGFWEDDPSGEAGESNSEPMPTSHEIGELEYKGGKVAKLRVPEAVKEVFGIEVVAQQPVHGVYVPSHRQPYVFQVVEEIPTKVDVKDQIFQIYLNEVIGRYTGVGANKKFSSPATLIKRSLISLATFGFGNEAVDRDEANVALFRGFEEVLKKTLPATLGFTKLRVKVPDVLLETETGPFAFEAASGGVAAIIDVAWQIFMYSQIHHNFVVVIDEPESHLHPALQQRLMPDLMQAFPTAQFVIATHNPFMVTSVAESNVYVLHYNENMKVVSRPLDTVNKAGSADEILMDVLGVPYTLPKWAKERMEEILKEFIELPFTDDSIDALETKMNGIGMSQYFPKMLAKVAEGKR